MKNIFVLFLIASTLLLAGCGNDGKVLNKESEAILDEQTVWLKDHENKILDLANEMRKQNISVIKRGTLPQVVSKSDENLNPEKYGELFRSLDVLGVWAINLNGQDISTEKTLCPGASCPGEELNSIQFTYFANSSLAPSINQQYKDYLTRRVIDDHWRIAQFCNRSICKEE